ncbi:hypothetical protein F5X96DRAFT_691596 [Biscogniauxia mediterranea]|nr:hypothetical protein F5X96DRAFT_691596 [Biscogniauxia mediterranea]
MNKTTPTFDFEATKATQQKCPVEGSLPSEHTTARTAQSAMGLLNNRVFEPETFVFVVGREAREFKVYKDVFRSLAPYFSVLMDGAMKEAREGRASWPDIDIPTFLRLCEFANANSYRALELPINLPPEGLNGVFPTSSVEIGLASALYGDCLWVLLTRMFASTSKFVTETFGGADAFVHNPPLALFARELLAHVQKGQPWTQAGRKATTAPGHPLRSFQFNLFCHVQMYILADMYGIAGLQALSLYRFAETLFFMDHRYFGELASVTAFAFDNTTSHDGLRRALALYMVCMRFAVPDVVDEFIDEFPELAAEMFHVTKKHVTYNL